jgi:hypothetical protein
MMGLLLQGVVLNTQREAAEHCRKMALAAKAQELATDRATVEMQYIGCLRQPEIRLIGGEHFAIIEREPSVPRVRRVAK